MRRPLIIALLLLPLFLSTASAQLDSWTVLLPVYISSGDYEGDYDVKGTRFDADGTVRWGGTKPKSLLNQPFREFQPSAVPDDAGGFVVAYTIEHIDTANLGDRDVLLRRVGPDGQNVWNLEAGPIAVVAQSTFKESNPRVVKLSSGAYLVAYEIVYDSTGDVDVAAMLFAHDGERVWAEPKWIANTDAREHLVAALPSTANHGLVVIEVESEAGSGAAENRDIFVSRIAVDGSAGWDSAGGSYVPVGVSSHSERNPVAVSDDSGGIYLAYEVAYGSGTRKGDVDILAQHITAAGVRLWTNPTAPPVVTSSSKAIEHSPSIVADSTGIVVAFAVDAVDTAGGAPLRIVAAQRLDRTGARVWNKGERGQPLLLRGRVPTSAEAIRCPSGGTYVLIQGEDTITGIRDLFVQKLSARGEWLWGNKGIAVPVFRGGSSSSFVGGLASPDSNDGLVVVAIQPPDSPLTAIDSTIVAQRITNDGKAAWGSDATNLTLGRCQLGDHPPTLIKVR